MKLVSCERDNLGLGHGLPGAQIVQPEVHKQISYAM